MNDTESQVRVKGRDGSLTKSNSLCLSLSRSFSISFSCYDRLMAPILVKDTVTMVKRDWFWKADKSEYFISHHVFPPETLGLTMFFYGFNFPPFSTFLLVFSFSILVTTSKFHLNTIHTSYFLEYFLEYIYRILAFISTQHFRS